MRISRAKNPRPLSTYVEIISNNHLNSRLLDMDRGLVAMKEKLSEKTAQTKFDSPKACDRPSQGPLYASHVSRVGFFQFISIEHRRKYESRPTWGTYIETGGLLR